jgi:hypothetical protein
MDHDNARTALNPASLALADVARLLAKVSGTTVTVAMIESDLAAGAPSNADGTINLTHYGAWLAREADRAD